MFHSKRLLGHYKTYNRRFSFDRLPTRIQYPLVIIAVGLVGWTAVAITRGATASIPSEAESGALTTNATVVTSTDASDGRAVVFNGSANAPTAPANLKTFTGGNSIAVSWSSSTANGSSIKQYDIYRDGSKVGSVTPGWHAEFPEKDGNGFIDKNVSSGKTYKYQVQALDQTNAKSALSSSASATQPTSSAPIPTITYNLNGATDLDSYMKNTVTPFIQTWYPKVANVVAYPDYTPYSSFTVTLDPNYTGIAYTNLDTGNITASTAYVRQNPQDVGLWLHEGTHTIQGQATAAGNNAQGFAIEGGADYPREYMYHDRDPTRPSGNSYYTDGYSPASYFINWIQTNFKADYLRALTVHGHNNAFGIADIQINGKNLDELWAQMLGKQSVTGPYTSVDSGKCLDGDAANTNNGTKFQIWDCNGNVAQKITSVSNGDGTVSLHVLGNCVDINNSGTANGSIVWLFGCNKSVAQQWIIQSDGSIKNPNSGRCLDITGAGSGGANGTQMEIWDCNGGNFQKWDIPAGSPKS